MKDGSIILTHEQRATAVAYLPTAGLPPVTNPPRRGRLPKGVVAMRREQKEADVQGEGEPMDPLMATYRMLDMLQCTLDLTRRRLAEYEKCHQRTG